MGGATRPRRARVLAAPLAAAAVVLACVLLGPPATASADVLLGADGTEMTMDRPFEVESWAKYAVLDDVRGNLAAGALCGKEVVFDGALRGYVSRWIAPQRLGRLQRAADDLKEQLLVVRGALPAGMHVERKKLADLQKVVGHTSAFLDVLATAHTLRSVERAARLGKTLPILANPITGTLLLSQVVGNLIADAHTSGCDVLFERFRQLVTLRMSAWLMQLAGDGSLTRVTYEYYEPKSAPMMCQEEVYVAFEWPRRLERLRGIARGLRRLEGTGPGSIAAARRRPVRVRRRAQRDILRAQQVLLGKVLPAFTGVFGIDPPRLGHPTPPISTIRWRSDVITDQCAKQGDGLIPPDKDESPKPPPPGKPAPPTPTPPPVTTDPQPPAPAAWDIPAKGGAAAWWRLDAEAGALSAPDAIGGADATLNDAARAHAGAAALPTSAGGAQGAVPATQLVVPADRMHHVGGDFSLEAWVRLATRPDRQTVAASRGRYSLEFDSSGQPLFVVGNTAARSTTPADVNRVYHLVGVLRGATVELWVDGVRAAESTASATLPPAGDEPFVIGASDDWGGTWARSVFGALDEIALYERALSAADIDRHSQSRSEVTPRAAPFAAAVRATSPTAFWRNGEPDAATTMGDDGGAYPGTFYPERQRRDAGLSAPAMTLPYEQNGVSWNRGGWVSHDGRLAWPAGSSAGTLMLYIGFANQWHSGNELEYFNSPQIRVYGKHTGGPDSGIYLQLKGSAGAIEQHVHHPAGGLMMLRWDLAEHQVSIQAAHEDAPTVTSLPAEYQLPPRPGEATLVELARAPNGPSAGPVNMATIDEVAVWHRMLAQSEVSAIIRALHQP